MVTPYAGVWIEMDSCLCWIRSVPVTPYAGVWIEIYFISCYEFNHMCHSLRGSVD